MPYAIENLKGTTTRLNILCDLVLIYIYTYSTLIILKSFVSNSEKVFFRKNLHPPVRILVTASVNVLLNNEHNWRGIQEKESN